MCVRMRENVCKNERECVCERERERERENKEESLIQGRLHEMDLKMMVFFPMSHLRPGSRFSKMVGAEKNETRNETDFFCKSRFFLREKNFDEYFRSLCSTFLQLC